MAALSDVARVKMVCCTTQLFQSSLMLNIASTGTTVYFNKVQIMLLCNKTQWRPLRIYACI